MKCMRCGGLTDSICVCESCGRANILEMIKEMKMRRQKTAEKIFDKLKEKGALRDSLPMHLDSDKFRFMVVDDIVQVLESCEQPTEKGAR